MKVILLHTQFSTGFPQYYTGSPHIDIHPVSYTSGMAEKGYLQPSGIPLSAVDDFIEYCGGTSDFQGLTTAQVFKKFMKPVTDEFQAAYSEILRMHNGTSGCSGAIEPRRATVYVAHSWNSCFLDILQTLKLYLAKSLNEERHVEHFVWLDLFCANQHMYLPFISQPNWHLEMSELITSIGHTVLVAPHLSDLTEHCLSQMWCMYEIFCSAGRTGSDYERRSTAGVSGYSGVNIAMLPHERDNFIVWVKEDAIIQATAVGGIDYTQSVAGRRGLRSSGSRSFCYPGAIVSSASATVSNPDVSRGNAATRKAGSGGNGGDGPSSFMGTCVLETILSRVEYFGGNARCPNTRHALQLIGRQPAPPFPTRPIKTAPRGVNARSCGSGGVRAGAGRHEDDNADDDEDEEDLIVDGADILRRKSRTACSSRATSSVVLTTAAAAASSTLGSREGSVPLPKKSNSNIRQNGSQQGVTVLLSTVIEAAVKGMLGTWMVLEMLGAADKELSAVAVEIAQLSRDLNHAKSYSHCRPLHSIAAPAPTATPTSPVVVMKDAAPAEEDTIALDTGQLSRLISAVRLCCGVDWLLGHIGSHPNSYPTTICLDACQMLWVRHHQQEQHQQHHDDHDHDRQKDVELSREVLFKAAWDRVVGLVGESHSLSLQLLFLTAETYAKSNKYVPTLS